MTNYQRVKSPFEALSLMYKHVPMYFTSVHFAFN